MRIARYGRFWALYDTDSTLIGEVKSELRFAVHADQALNILRERKAKA